MLQVAQRQHRGQHGVRERRRRARIRSTPPSSTARCPRSPKASAGKGERIGQATTDANQVLLALNPRSETIRADWQALKGFSDTYSGAAQDILTTLNAASTTSATITSHAKQLDALLLATIGLSNSGISLLAPNQANLIKAINVLEPTTNLLYKYNPEYTCLLVGAKTLLDTGGYEAPGGNGRSLVLDAGLALGDDPYHYPGEPAGHRRQGRTRRQAGVRLAARRRQELAGAPARHQHRFRHRDGLAAQPRHRLPGLGQLPPGHPRGARAAEHPQPLRRARDRADPVPGRPGLRRDAVRAGRHPAVAGPAAGAAADGAAGSRSDAGLRAVRRPAPAQMQPTPLPPDSATAEAAPSP